MAFTQLPTGGGVPNVDLITQTLAKLQPDSALQNYARMHKNDPYILSLATAESNRRKALRLAAQGQNAGPQPTVADQSIAGMASAPVMTGSGGTLQTGYGGPVMTGMASGGLPEDQGIAQLSTPNMQYMADGGIAGYEDDEEGMATGGMGGMFNFAQQSEPVVRMSGGGHVPRYQGNTTDGSVVGGIPGFQAVQPRAQFTQQGAPENTPFFQRIMESLSGSNKERQLAMIEQKIAQGTASPEEIAAYKEVKIKGGDKAATFDQQALRDAKYPPQDAIRTKNFPGVKPGFEQPPTDMYGAPTDKTPPSATGGVKDLLPNTSGLNTSFKPAKAPTIDDAKTLSDKFFNTDKRVNEINRQVTQEQMDANTAKENSIAALEAFNKKQGPAFAGYEQTLKKDELQDATDKEKAGLMALFKGFLGIAAGESPNAAVNIAKGALLGVDDYNVAMKDLKKSAKERNKEFQYIEQARRAEDRGNFDKAQSFEEKAESSRQASARFGIAAINDITNAGAKASTDIYNTITTNRSRENIAASGEVAQNLRTKATIEAQLNTPDRLVFNQLLKDNNNNPVAAAEALQKLKAEKFNVYDAYTKYLLAFAGKENIMKGPDDFDVFAKRYVPTVTPDKNTTIRTQPGG